VYVIKERFALFSIAVVIEYNKTSLAQLTDCNGLQPESKPLCFSSKNHLDIQTSLVNVSLNLLRLWNGNRFYLELRLNNNSLPTLRFHFSSQI